MIYQIPSISIYSLVPHIFYAVHVMLSHPQDGLWSAVRSPYTLVLQCSRPSAIP